MRTLFGLIIVFSGTFLGWYLDIGVGITEPIVYYLIGGLSSILGTAIVFSD